MKYILAILAVLSIAACGGGGSSSEPSTSAPAPTSTVYSGTQALIRTSGATTASTSALFQMTVSLDGAVVISDLAGAPLTANGSMSGSNFTANGSVTGSSFGDSCEVNITYTGAVLSGDVSGSISGAIICPGTNGSTTISLSGTFSGSLN